ncbi:MAG: 4-(cytidine 5'-diphospho)-2-C-methyl-D-erythritol kinase [Eggerthellaceae bacterium]|nr:4-(cytidine 5'-diphospho)-2-C-methyl-D-erythritol kinase [Eggerthellaceae bacterium]
MQTINVIAPAKVNLFLGIGKCREDGYHDATTVMHALSMHDKLAITHIGSGEHVVVVEPNDPAQPERQEEVKVEPGSGLSVTVRNLWFSGIAPLQIPNEDNLVYKAIHTLANTIGRHEDEAIRVVVEKRIPYQAGLGGGSSDAAAAMLGVAHLWGVEDDDEMLQDVARQLGADVRFFIHGGCALLEGRGDWLERQLEPRRDSVVIIRPEGGVSTAEAYRLFDESPRFFGRDVLEAVRGAQAAVDVPLGNNLQEPAFMLHPEIPKVCQIAVEAPGVRDVLLCGSGSAVFAICESYESAQALTAEAQRAGYWARATSFSGVRAAILPSRR